MAANSPPTVSSDGWVGDPDLLTQTDEIERRKFFAFGGFALARRVFFSGFIALSMLFIGILFVSQVQSNVVSEKRSNMVEQSELMANVLSKALTEGDNKKLSMIAAFEGLPTSSSNNIYLYDTSNEEVGAKPAAIYQSEVGDAIKEIEQTGSTGLLRGIALFISRIGARFEPRDDSEFRKTLASQAMVGGTEIADATSQNGISLVGVARPILSEGKPIGSVVLAVPPGLIEFLASTERRGIVGLYLISVLALAFLSHLVARTISEPLHDLATAAELGKSAQLGDQEAARMLVPDLVGRNDAVGRLSAAMGDMINALYDRIDTNERFAADVVHEIKNPLASMRSAVETLRIAPEGDGRKELLNILEKDVQRLDRMVSDISNASRLDGELVSEETEQFELTLMLQRICEFHRMPAKEDGIELIWEQPAKAIMFDGLEERLAQVFVNLVTNAVSFCENGDAIRVWARIRKSRILVVVEDTGPGIPEESLQKIFRRFYSQRPEQAFGNHSGLGLAISRQIVEAHGGVIWAENIREEGASSQEPSLGARFVVGLPI